MLCVCSRVGRRSLFTFDCTKFSSKIFDRALYDNNNNAHISILSSRSYNFRGEVAVDKVLTNASNWPGTVLTLALTALLLGQVPTQD